MAIYSNIVGKDTLRSIQSNTLKALYDYISQSFGPYGSNTIQYKKEGYPRYTKDGHTILKNVMFGGEIEQAVLADIMEETRAQAKRVGDSTTSVTILSHIVFEKLSDIEKRFPNTPPVDIVRTLKEVVDCASNIIKTHGKEATIDDIRKISLISTNNDEKLTEEIVKVYEELGLNAFIDVLAGSSEEFTRKVYDGMFFDCGYHDACFINMPEKGVNRLENPRIYYFKDPVDNMSYGNLFDSIIANNIINPINELTKVDPNNPPAELPQIIPTVIIAPKVVRDYARTLEIVMEYCAKYAKANLPNQVPLNIITGVTETDVVYLKNILTLCGVPTINKYDDAKTEERDQKNNTAPTPNNVSEWYGTAAVVESGAFNTKFIDPKNYKVDGKYTDVFNAVLNDLDARISELEKQHNETLQIYQLKKQKNSLLGNMVELYVGGITIADRDQVRDLVEDAVLNCRSAVDKGVGYGANFEGLRAFKSLYDACVSNGSLKEEIIKALYEAYKDITKLLYRYMDGDGEQLVVDSLMNDCPFDVRTGEKGENVLSSIDTDICVLNSISKIISLMVTANQFQMSTLNINKY